jgi:hypothetical protein
LKALDVADSPASAAIFLSASEFVSPVVEASMLILAAKGKAVFNSEEVFPF